MKYFLSFILIGFVALSTFAQSEKISIRFIPIWNDQPFSLHQKNALNNRGDSISFSKAKFYVSQFSLWNGKHETAYNDVHLVDFEDNQSIMFSIANQQVDKIQFLLGIDSSTNVSGALGGSLDPANGMYWTWQSGYINVKLEGEYFPQNGEVVKFNYHLGGYRAPYMANKWITNTRISSTREFEIQCQFKSIIEEKISEADFSIMSPSLKSKQMVNEFANSFLIINKAGE